MDYSSTDDYSSSEDDELSEESKLEISQKVEALEKDREARWNDFMERYSTRDCGSSSDVVEMDNIENFVTRSFYSPSLQSSEVEQIDFEANDCPKPSCSKKTSGNCIPDEISIYESQKSECFKLSKNMKEEEQIIDLKNFIENVLNIKLEAYFVQLWSSIIKRDGKQSVLRKVFLENLKIVRKKVDDDLIIMYLEKSIQLPDAKKLFYTIEEKLNSDLKLYFAMRDKNIKIHDVNSIEKEWELLEKEISTKEICWYHAILFGFSPLFVFKNDVLQP